MTTGPEALMVLDRWSIANVGSNPSRDIDICPHFLCCADPRQRGPTKIVKDS
jgi:hypothetical protein